LHEGLVKRIGKRALLLAREAACGDMSFEHGHRGLLIDSVVAWGTESDAPRVSCAIRALRVQARYPDLGVWIDTYLSEPHREHPDLGCPMAALAGFMRQQAPDARASMAKVLASQIGTLTDVMRGIDPAKRRRAANR